MHIGNVSNQTYSRPNFKRLEFYRGRACSARFSPEEAIDIMKNSELKEVVTHFDERGMNIRVSKNSKYPELIDYSVYYPVDNESFPPSLYQGELNLRKFKANKEIKKIEGAIDGKKDIEVEKQFLHKKASRMLEEYNRHMICPKQIS